MRASRVRRYRQLWMLGALVAAVLVLVLVVKGSTNKAPDDLPNGGAEVTNLLRGVPQRGTSLGSESAPVTLVEFTDLKCPACHPAVVELLPTLIDRYVRKGKLRMEAHLQTFVSERTHPGDSSQAARFALAAAQQNKFWSFIDLFYINQRDASTRYVTDGFLTYLAKGIPGFNVAAAMKARTSPTVTQQLIQDKKLFTNNGLKTTPSFLIGRTGSRLKPLVLSSFDVSQLTNRIDKLLDE